MNQYPQTLKMNDLTKNTQGSIWHRWEPHIHTPGTLLNNQFSGTNGGWDDYIARINAATPTIRAIGVTDYYDIEAYEKMLQLHSQGLFPNVALLFANVEIRFVSGTGRDKAINGHLLISPEDPNHVANTKRFLQSLHFAYGGHRYRCDRADLIALGRAHDPSIRDEMVALRSGANQFKVNLDELKASIKGDIWAQEHLLLGVAGNTSDGTSGLASDASFDALRKEYERNSHVVFASSERQRLFWIGKTVHTRDEIEERWGGLKPCLHGSDAHNNQAVGNPEGNRYTWVKGDITFESLRQACIEPENRAIVSAAAPTGVLPSRTIKSIKIQQAPWMTPDEHLLNSGLVAIIGARGSGKTALADMIAVGAYAMNNRMDERSFIRRAQTYLQNVEVEVAWNAGDNTRNAISSIDFEDIWDTPKLQYLSQQFVDRLCSSEGVTDQLISEIERVIYNAHPMHERAGASNFAELLQMRTANARTQQSEGISELDGISKMIETEYAKEYTIPQLARSIQEKTAIITADKATRQGLIGSGQAGLAENINKVSAALDAKNAQHEGLKRTIGALQRLQSSVGSSRNSGFPDYTNKLRLNNTEAGLSAEQWVAFNINYVGDVDTIITNAIGNATTQATTLVGNTSEHTVIEATSPPFVSDYDNLSAYTLITLSNELKRLQIILGIDNANADQFKRLTAKLSIEENELENLKRQLVDAQGATGRIQSLIQGRRAAYNKVISSIITEQTELQKLYQPLMSLITGKGGTLGKLAFNVDRKVDIDAWAARGEALLDRRMQSGFRGVGTLSQVANTDLRAILTTGTAEEIAEAVSNFVQNNIQSILGHSPYQKSDTVNYRNWMNQIGSWLFDASHITPMYSIQYDGVDIQQLSPGTRGIVLLLIFLAIDLEDDRPLLIDQPEENLDPKSIFDELVPLFSVVKNRRQIIIVTHNANLVINTDADQVIVAKGGQHRPNQLPDINYVAGGLENPAIRAEVCSILEGGETALKERARRLRVHF